MFNHDYLVSAEPAWQVSMKHRHKFVRPLAELKNATLWLATLHPKVELDKCFGRRWMHRGRRRGCDAKLNWKELISTGSHWEHWRWILKRCKCMWSSTIQLQSGLDLIFVVGPKSVLDHSMTGFSQDSYGSHFTCDRAKTWQLCCHKG